MIQLELKLVLSGLCPSCEGTTAHRVHVIGLWQYDEYVWHRCALCKGKGYK